MDEAPLRRGVPTAQYIYGNSSAILAGDVLFARASGIVAKLGARRCYCTPKHLNVYVWDSYMKLLARDGEDPIAHHIQVLADKTGSLIAAAGRYGVLYSGGDPKLADDIAQFGEKLA